MAHAGRRFEEAFKAQKKSDGRSRQALEFFGFPYQAETLAGVNCPEAKRGSTVRGTTRASPVPVSPGMTSSVSTTSKRSGAASKAASAMWLSENGTGS